VSAILPAIAERKIGKQTTVSLRRSRKEYKRFREKFDKLYLDAATEDQSKFKLYRIAKVSSSFTFPRLRPKDINDKYISRNELTQWDYCSKTLQEKVQDKVNKKEKSVSFCFGSGEETSVLISKIKRLAEMDEESLKSAISTLVTQGSNKPGRSNLCSSSYF